MTAQRQDPKAEHLDRYLRELPAARASAGFTERVLDQLHRPVPVSDPVPATRLAWGALGLAALLVVGLTFLREPAEGPAASLSEEASEIRRQHALLTEELDRLRSRTHEAAPVLYLGSDNEVDYVLDLSPFLLPPAGGIMPASNNNSSTTF
ncbi:MAG: hypothetical protein ACE5GX_01040 [Thermoanaerobaculia bacterium]